LDHEIGSTQIRSAKHVSQAPSGSWSSDTGQTEAEGHAAAIEGAARLAEASSRRIEAVRLIVGRVAGLPETTGKLLNGSSQCLDFDSGRRSFASLDSAVGFTCVSVNFCARPTGWRYI